MGLVLRCSGDAVPNPDAPFLVLTPELGVSAVSLAGENLFGAEESLVGTQLLALLTSPLGDDQLEHRTRLAAQRLRDPVVLPMRLRSGSLRKAGAFAARIATCGPPRAALIAVVPSALSLR